MLAKTWINMNHLLAFYYLYLNNFTSQKGFTIATYAIIRVHPTVHTASESNVITLKKEKHYDCLCVHNEKYCL